MRGFRRSSTVLVAGDFNCARVFGKQYAVFFDDMAAAGFHDAHWAKNKREVRSFWRPGACPRAALGSARVDEAPLLWLPPRLPRLAGFVFTVLLVQFEPPGLRAKKCLGALPTFSTALGQPEIERSTLFWIAGHQTD